MKVLTGTSAGVASNAYRIAGEDGLTFGDEDFGEVTIADAEVAVAKDDEVTWTGVVVSAFYCVVEHGIDYGGLGGEVNAVVHRALASEWVGAVAEGWCDFDIAERIGHGDVTCLLRCVFR